MHRAVCFLPAVVLAAAFSPFIGSAQTKAAPLSVEQIYAHGSLAGDPPEGLTWSPDGKHLTCLRDGELVEFDVETAKARALVSRTKLGSLSGSDGSEQDRDHRERYKMAKYAWAPDSRHLLFDSNGRLWYYDLQSGTGVQIGFTGEFSGDDPKFSPNGDSISFIRNHGLALVHPRDINGAAGVAVAPPPNDSTLNGEVDWLYEEELEVRSNYFWSPDSKNIAYLQMNESNVPQYPIEDWIPTHARVEAQRYPQPGDPNPGVRVGVVGASGGKTSWIRLPAGETAEYVPRFGWVDRHTVWLETLTRDHKHRNLYFADITSGQSRLVVTIGDDKFVDDNYDVFVSNGSIVLSNWTDGHNHIYLYTYDPVNPLPNAPLVGHQLTRGEFDVTGISTVDVAHQLIFYSSNQDHALQQQLGQVNFRGETKPLTRDAGFHDGNFSPSGAAFIDTFSTRMSPDTLRLCQTGGKCNEIWSTHALAAYKLRAPESLQAKAKDGSTLYATLLLPEGANSPASVPVIVNPYGGPGPQEVVDKWNYALLFDEILAQHGFAVLHTDNRGTGGRGRNFAQAAFHNFGAVQLEDQFTVLDAALQKFPQLDKQRLGWWGWSWGGSFTLYALTHSDRFRAGVAVAPVTDWRDYDSIYTERYMSQPSEFPAGYKDFSAVNSAARLKGRLLLVQGTGDDNVHMENSVQFIQQLIDAGLPYDLQIYPRKTHSLAGAVVRTHLFNRILAEFEQYLKPAGNASSVPGRGQEN